MDTLKLINKKINMVQDTDLVSKIKIILTHIERSEKLYLLGLEENDDNYYTDVIYRTNQAFEGILKVCFNILTGKKSEKKTPNEIEKYFEEKNILHTRILELFKNYRTEWRNSSTHDYKLFFSEEEAYLAILSVTSFINLLLNQIIEKISFNMEKDVLSKNNIEIIRDIENYTNLDLTNKVKNLLINFTKYQKNTKEFKLEHELLGAIEAYLNLADPSIKIIRDSVYQKRYRPDFVIKFGEEEVLVEVKKDFSKNRIDALKAQLLNYIDVSNIKNSIGYIYTYNENAIYNDSNISFNKYEDNTLLIISPS
jgi:hypothetical protein